MPLGLYVAEITDSCGRTAQGNYEVKEKKLIPIKNQVNATCTTPTGIIRVTIPEGRKIVAAVIVAAPAAYTQPLPSDVSSFINATTGSLLVTDLPIGGYDVVVTDECGVVYNTPLPIHFELTAFQALTPDPPIVRPGCSASEGSIRLRSKNGALTSASITAAPAAFAQTLPFDVTSGITSGILYISDLPAGSYDFTVVDACGFTYVVPSNVSGYDPGVNNFEMHRNCGSFDVSLHDNSNIIGDSYWFQKLNPNTNVWEHPDTGTAYPEGTIPTADNSIALTNLSTLFNLTAVGTYRIIKIYQTFDGGNANCIQIYDSFTYTGSLDILSVFSLDCTGGGGQASVFLEVLGVPPYHFTITSPVAFDNFNSNIFTNLGTGLYVLKVEDSCGRIEFVNVNVGTLLPLVEANNPTPSELLLCGTPGQQTASFDLNTLKSSILANQPPDNYVVTYHLSQNECRH
ncbi:hypothetical protein [Flavobacterium sp. 3HN19-14]|uniref:hypothetical protein n=1 Tax=Flavobacterium sp. 3HN19-14 TaxID=3448133 RepID=UPI003EE2ABED